MLLCLKEPSEDLVKSFSSRNIKSSKLVEKQSGVTLETVLLKLFLVD